jgi:hypothetical protein
MSRDDESRGAVHGGAGVKENEIQVGATYSGRTSGADRKVRRMDHDNHLGRLAVWYDAGKYTRNRFCTLESFAKWADKVVMEKRP